MVTDRILHKEVNTVWWNGLFSKITMMLKDDHSSPLGLQVQLTLSHHGHPAQRKIVVLVKEYPYL